MNRKQRKQSQQIRVNVYAVNQAFGGHEEGGWWYDVGQFVQCAATFYNRANARAYADELRAVIDATENDPRGSRANLSSVICEGRICVYVENQAGEDFPRSRPYYC